MRRPFAKRTHTPRDPSRPAADERVWGRNYRGPAPWIFGLLVVGLLSIGIYLAFAKDLPFTGKGYELTATFENAATLRETSPVRIAGVNVGKVTSIEPDGELAKVTFTVDEDGQPIHDDAEVEIRPRLFLEGNFFLDLTPGSPSAPELDSGGDDPGDPDRDRGPARRGPRRRSRSRSAAGLQKLLSGYGTALTYEPTEADDIGQDPSVQGESAAESLNDAFRYGGRAGRGTAIVNEALLGENPHDLSGFIDSAGSHVREARRPRAGALRSDHQLQHLRRRPRRRVGEPLADVRASSHRRSRRPSRRSRT